MTTGHRTAEHSPRVVKVGTRAVRLEHVVQAPRELVWKAYTEPALVARWWARGNPMDVERMDLVKGGHWRFVEHSADGADGFEGRFRDISPPERLEQTFEYDGWPGHPAVSSCTFRDLGDDCTRVETTMLFMTAADRDAMVASGMEEGMRKSYAALDRILAAA